MAPIDAASAQKPVPELVSMQTPAYLFPASVTSTLPTSPINRSPS